MDSDTIIDIPLTDLGIDSIAQAFSRLVSTVKLQYKRKVELILCDCFKTFLEERVMKRLKDRLGLEITFTATGSTLHQLGAGNYTMCFMVKLILGV